MTSLADKYPPLSAEQHAALKPAERRQYDHGIIDIEDVRRIVAERRQPREELAWKRQ